MTEDRRSFARRDTDITAAIETAAGESLDPQARVLNLSIAGARLASGADLAQGIRYRIKLAGTRAWIEVSVQERVGDEYRCLIETPWDDLHDAIRESDDLMLLVLDSSEDPSARN
jgi:hypothetical protein